MKKLNLLLLLTIVSVLVFAQPPQRFVQSEPVQREGFVAPGAELVQYDGFISAEGPAVDKDGRIYFSDQLGDKIYVWDEEKGCSLWLEGVSRANGMMFDKQERLIACTELRNELGYFDKETKEYHVIASGYNGKLLNAPNDVWVTDNGYYITDPYWQRDFWPQDRKEEQDVKGVYFVSLKGEIKRVIDDFRVPNGIYGAPDGKTLYVADMGNRQTWKYTMQPNGDLTDKTLAAPSGSDGMSMDNQGNIYLTSRRVLVYSPEGELMHEIVVPGSPTNVTFGGKNRDVLFITAWTSVYTLKMSVKGNL